MCISKVILDWNHCLFFFITTSVYFWALWVWNFGGRSWFDVWMNTWIMENHCITVTGKVVVMWLWGHGFKVWKQPLAEMRGKATYNRTLWFSDSLDLTHSGSCNAPGCRVSLYKSNSFSEEMMNWSSEESDGRFLVLWISMLVSFCLLILCRIECVAKKCFFWILISLIVLFTSITE